MNAPDVVAPFGLYVHWPFCQAKCPYCDFNSHVAVEVDHARWRRAYLSEIERLGRYTGPRPLHTIFFGGGTPSLMPPETVAEILAAARRTWPWANDVEITLEANPTSVEAGRFRAFRDAGINRVSVGVQALNDTDLKRLGRMHSAVEARSAFALAREIFPRASFDLIYARQNQSMDAWRSELSEALDMAADHLSLYQLTIEEGTVFGARHAVGQLRGLPEEDVAADMYELTQDLCGAAGMAAYEVSNHARHNAESRHNLLYWRGDDYGGIGPGAHGRLTVDGSRVATQTELLPGKWLHAVERLGNGETERIALTEQEQFEERLMMGLRLSEGVDLARSGVDLAHHLPREKLERLIADGFMERVGGRLRTTARGRPLLNAILRDLLT